MTKELAKAAKGRGNTAFTSGDFPKAVEEFSAAIELDPTDHVFFSNRSGAYASLNQYEDALKDANSCIEIKSDWAKGYTRKGLALYKLDKFEEAKQTYEAGLVVDPNNASNKDGLAQVELAIEQAANPMSQLFGEQMWGKLAMNPVTRPYLDDAAFVQKLKLLQKNPQMLSSLGNDPKMSTAIGVILGIGDLGGGAGGGFGGAGGADFAAEDEEAEKKKKAKEEEKKMEEEEEKRKQEAEDEMEDWEKEEIAQKKQAEEKKKQGNEFYKKRKFDEALSHYQEASTLDPANVTYESNKAAVYFEKKEFDTCIETCRKAIETATSNKGYDFKLVGKLYTRIGNALCKKKEWVEAKEAYQKGMLEDYTDSGKRALKKVDDWLKKEAEKAYISPEESMKAKEEGNKLFQEQKWVDAIEKYSDALKRDPSNYKVYSNRAACYTKLMDWQRGMEDCEACLKADPKFVKAYIRKGKIQHFLKQYHKALDTYQIALELDPQCSDLIDAKRLTMAKIQEENQSGVDPARQAEAMKDPEIQMILQDPMMSATLKNMQTDPAAAQKAFADPIVRAKIEKLVAAGIVQMG